MHPSEAGSCSPCCILPGPKYTKDFFGTADIPNSKIILQFSQEAEDKFSLGMGVAFATGDEKGEREG